MFDTKLKETSLPVIRTETLTENPGRFVSMNTNNWTTDPGSWLVDPVDDEDVEEIVQRTDPPNFWQFAI